LDAVSDAFICAAEPELEELEPLQNVCCEIKGSTMYVVGLDRRRMFVRELHVEGAYGSDDITCSFTVSSAQLKQLKAAVKGTKPKELARSSFVIYPGPDKTIVGGVEMLPRGEYPNWHKPYENVNNVKVWLTISSELFFIVSALARFKDRFGVPTVLFDFSTQCLKSAPFFESPDSMMPSVEWLFQAFGKWIYEDDQEILGKLEPVWIDARFVVDAIKCLRIRHPAAFQWGIGAPNEQQVFKCHNTTCIIMPIGRIQS
ncbi:MAG: hypothetical protein NZ739_11870, partial [Verrucomicrobiae bacterium]|nr:hypothetical protein [Verrucomicrobiae bacterium]